MQLETSTLKPLKAMDEGSYIILSTRYISCFGTNLCKLCIKSRPRPNIRARSPILDLGAHPASTTVDVRFRTFGLMSATRFD